MNWSEERWVRVYCRDTAEWCRWSDEARAVFLMMLRIADRSGTIECSDEADLAVMLRLRSPAWVLKAIPELCEKRGDAPPAVMRGVGGFVIRNYAEAQESPMSDVHRAREARARQRMKALGGELSSDNQAPASRDVTEHHTTSRDVTPCLPFRSDPIRSDPCRAIRDRKEIDPDSAPDGAVIELADRAESREGADSPVLVNPVAASRSPVDVVLDHYAECGRAWGKQRPRGEGARRKVEARLRRFSVDEVLRAITGLFASPWHNGTDPRSNGKRYLDLEQVVRADERVEKFRDMAPAPIGRDGDSTAASSTPPVDAELQRLAAEAEAIYERNRAARGG